jgi:hypothetical protein
MIKNKLQYFLLVIFLIVLSLNLFLSLMNITTIRPSLKEMNSKKIQSSNVPNISTFPVNMSLLFWEDDPTFRNSCLDNIEAGGGDGWMMTPWGTYFMSGHAEGAPKWYLYARRNLEVFTPCSGSLDSMSIGDDSVIKINGNSFIKDVGIVIDLGSDYRIELGHLVINKSIFEEIQSKDSYDFREGEVIGYTSNLSALDFYLSYNHRSVCPYSYLNTDLKSKLDAYYDLQYERAKIAGIWPESEICRNMSIEIENTIWGPWMYKTGPFDDLIENSEGWLPYQGQVVSFLNINFTNDETFYKNPLDHSENLSESVVGLVRDNPNADNVTEYKEMGKCMVELVQGDFKEGILLIRTMDHITEYGPENTTFYAKILVDPQKSSYKDDLLQVQYFSNLSDAQSAFTNASIIYERFYFEYNNNYNPNKDIFFHPVFITLSLFIGIGLCFIIFREKAIKLVKEY